MLNNHQKKKKKKTTVYFYTLFEYNSINQGFYIFFFPLFNYKKYIKKIIKSLLVRNQLPIQQMKMFSQFQVQQHYKLITKII